MDSSRFLSLLHRSRRVLAACTVLAALAGWAVTLTMSPTYESRSVVLVGSALSSVTVNREQLDVSRQLTETYAAVAMSRPALERVAGRVGIDASVMDVEVTPQQDPPLLSITALGRSPQEAAAIANEVVTELTSVSPGNEDRERQSREFISRQLTVLEDEIDSVSNEIDRLLAISSRTQLQEDQLAERQLRLTELQDTYATLLTASSRRDSSMLTVLEQGIATPDPVSPRPLQNILLAGAVGLALGVLLVVLRERWQETIRRPEDAEAALGVPTIGVIPRMPGFGGRNAAVERVDVRAHSSGGEAFDSLQANLDMLVGDSLTSLLVTSAAPSEGKTTIAANLAAAVARSGRHVVLVDGDLQHPSIHRHFGLRHRHGVSDYLRTPNADPADILQDTAVDRLQVVPAGQQIPSAGLQLMGSPRARELIHRLTTRADLVILDGPSIIGVSETAVMGTFVDATLLVVNAGEARRPSLEAARDALTGVGAPIVGSVLNHAQVSRQATAWTPPRMAHRRRDRRPLREGRP